MFGGHGGSVTVSLSLSLQLVHISPVLSAGATIHTVAGLWMNVKPRNAPAAAHTPTAAAAGHSLTAGQQSESPQQVPVGAAAFDSSSSSSSGAAAGGKCPFSGALTALSGNGTAAAAAGPPAPAV
jgi:hypothetical protein